MRKKISVEHLLRATDCAERNKFTLLLENLNVEPKDAEVHYLGYSIDELRMYFDAIASSNLKGGFGEPHASVAERFLCLPRRFAVSRIGLVLVACNRGASRSTRCLAKAR